MDLLANGDFATGNLDLETIDLYSTTPSVTRAVHGKGMASGGSTARLFNRSLQRTYAWKRPAEGGSSLRHAGQARPCVARRALANMAAPVTQNTRGARGPTAMVFMNMGGPSTTDEVGDFLSRLFVGNMDSRRAPGY